MAEPENEFAHMTLPELRAMLRDTLRHAEAQDAAFVQWLAHAIAAREQAEAP
jgi:hypothetical protein